MRVLADENIPYAREAFEHLGEVVQMPGRAITREALRDTGLLVVRSITKVGPALLEGTPVRFVGTCTIGEDHIDKAYLAEQGIGFSSAPGCNANSVAEYLVAALLTLADRHRLDLGRLSLGVVGVGNVGSKVVRKAEALGLACVLNDPPLAGQTGDAKYRPIEDILACDIVTLHVPLTKEGPHATRHLVDAAFLECMKPGAILINTSRGAVVSGTDLLQALAGRRLRGCVLDVWENEPDIDVNLLECVDIGTPHIAGYSFDGKVNGTMQVYAAACRHFGVEPAFDVAPLLPEPPVPALTAYPDEPDALSLAVRTVYDIMADDAAMREMLSLPAGERATRFDALRKHYPVRREFFNTRAQLEKPDDGLRGRLAGIGFRVTGAP